jgi:SulP family sulfate permease
MIQAALMIAGMSSVYTLIGALIADSALGTRHNTNRELIGQGVGNAVSGLMGGLAGTGTAVRTMVNIRNGGRTRASGIMSSLMILGIVLGCGQHVNRVPIPLLAGLLIKAGWDIMDWSYLKTVRRTWPFERVLFIMIILLTLFADLLWAMGFGVTLAALWSVTTLSEVQKKHVFFREVDNVRAPAVRQPDAMPQTVGVQPDAPVRSVSFQGALGYGFSIELASVLGQCRHDPAVLLDWRHVTYMDTTIGLAFGRFFTQRKAAHRLTFVLLPSQEPLEAWIRALGILRAVPDPCVLSAIPSDDHAWATLIQQATAHAESAHQKGH